MDPAEKPTEPLPNASPAPRPTPKLRLDLDPGLAAGERDEGWGDSSETSATRLQRYLHERPPHHGG